ncbi:MAG TPA: 16S rRNA (cytosine(967)-C(5))-methyltransferase RsmB [Vicinamibacterales bacterium]|nr:16S rRNA (cytosine(967)-C(5))-methyltransferase RsmB [Vicinamibacterales bacterium]
MIAPARVAAYEALLAVSAGTELPAAVALARGRLTDERDRALATDMAAGVQRWRAAIDHLIVAFANRRLDRLDPEVLEILRLSAYQLLHLTRVPASAVVDDAVDLAKRAGKTSASGFVNAVLRTISRKRASLPLPPRPTESGAKGPPEGTSMRESALDYLSITLSHPRWLVDRWYDRFGFADAETWCAFNNAPAPLTLRANRLRTTPGQLVERLAADDVRVRHARYAPDALIVEEGMPLRAPGVDSGLFVVQDEASQLVALAAHAQPGMRVLDACASPGGKTSAMAADLDGRGLLVACDVRARRMGLLRQTIGATGANARLVQADLLRPLPFSRPFDLVVVDAPCSGLGTLRRDPDIRWRRREQDLALLAASALTMLQRAADAVGPGGRLVYATCSSEPEENEAVAAAFLATTPAFAGADLRAIAPALAADLVDGRGHLRTAPHRHQLEAFFAAAFVRM